MTAVAAPLPLRLAGSRGIGLTADAWGNPEHPPLLLLHGGGQTRSAWAPAAATLANLGWRVIAPDLRGHGESDWSPEGAYSVDDFAGDVRTLASTLGRPAVLVGASLGGLASLLAAGEPPRAAVRALVLVDVAHRPEPAGVARILDFMRARPDGFASVDEAAAAVADYLPHRDRPDSLTGLERNLRPRGGRWAWHWDPRLLERASKEALPETAARNLAAARSIESPVLLVRGAASDVISADIAAEFCAHVPAATCVDVADAGHMVAGDQNDRFVGAILPFLAGIASDP